MDGGAAAANLCRQKSWNGKSSPRGGAYTLRKGLFARSLVTAQSAILARFIRELFGRYWINDKPVKGPLEQAYFGNSITGKPAARNSWFSAGMSCDLIANQLS